MHRNQTIGALYFYENILTRHGPIMEIKPIKGIFRYNNCIHAWYFLNRHVKFRLALFDALTHLEYYMKLYYNRCIVVKPNNVYIELLVMPIAKNNYRLVYV